MDFEKQMLIDRLVVTLDQYADAAPKEDLHVLYVNLAALFARRLEDEKILKWIDTAERDLANLQGQSQVQP